MAAGASKPDASGEMREEDEGDSATQTLELALSNSEFYAPFAAFSKDEHNQENLLLWKAIREFEEADPDTRPALAKRVVSRFVRSGAPLEVNMEEGRRAEIGSVVKSGSIGEVESQFALLRQTALQQMLVDSLPRFMRSSHWKEAAASRGEDVESVSFGVSHGRRVTFSSTGHPRLSADLDALRRDVEAEEAEGSKKWEAPAHRRQSTMDRLRRIEELGFTGEGTLRVEDLELGAAASRNKRRVLGFSMRAGHSKEQEDALQRIAKCVQLPEAQVWKGFMEKRGDHHQTWKRRFFILAAPTKRRSIEDREAAEAEEEGAEADLYDFGDQEIPVPQGKERQPRVALSALVYFAAAEPSAAPDTHTIKGVIPIAEVQAILPTAPAVAAGPDKPFAFGLRTNHGRTFIFSAASISERRRWLRALCNLTGARPISKL